ncbi:MAG: YlmC/YmxH family sporulation protein [Oscillospiraceae bacterium]|nr:YlmC/YmxH family sporulation protein [Oscillospiraceae bacterium]
MNGRFSELKRKWVIDRKGGSILGRVTDLEIDMARNRVVSVVAGQKKHWFLPFSVTEESVIPWQQIDVIGEDTILVIQSTKEGVSEPEKRP